MKRGVMRGYVLVVAAALVLCGLLCAVAFDLRLTEDNRQELTRLAGALADSFDPEGDHDAQADRFSQATGGLRVTVIEADGRVSGDSHADYAAMENHADRAEILQARGTVAAVSVRASETLGRRLMYAVVRTDTGIYLRLAKEYPGLLGDLMSLAPAVLVAAALALLISLFFAGRVATGISRPIVRLNDSLNAVLDGRATLDPESYGYEELRDMARKVNELSADIQTHIGQLEEEREKIDFILDNMSEGFVLLDEDHRVLSINRSACQSLGCTKEVVGKHVLHMSRNYTLYENLGRALERGVDAAVDLNLGGRVVEARLNVVSEKRGGIEGGLIIVLSDVTESRRAIQMRREFFSNASHELKTPITSIKGFAELLSSGAPLEQEQLGELYGHIATESERMSQLISDIIMISRLESGELAGDREPLDFAQVLAECCQEVAAMARSQDVELHTDIHPAPVMANRKDLHQLADNLLSNAVHYNHAGGQVWVRLDRQGDQVVLEVRNSGEPIPPEHQSRVFERFYRVDKGRSKTVGGTGLGLSIVKHVVDSLGGTVSLRSGLEEGTVFTVSLPGLAQGASSR